VIATTDPKISEQGRQALTSLLLTTKTMRLNKSSILGLPPPD
jgi:hypothetical protein